MVPNSALSRPSPATGAARPASAGQVAMQASAQLLVPLLSLVNAYRARPGWSVRMVPRPVLLALTVSASACPAWPDEAVLLPLAALCGSPALPLLLQAATVRVNRAAPMAKSRIRMVDSSGYWLLKRCPERPATTAGSLPAANRVRCHSDRHRVNRP